MRSRKLKMIKSICRFVSSLSSSEKRPSTLIRSVYWSNILKNNRMIFDLYRWNGWHATTLDSWFILQIWLMSKRKCRWLTEIEDDCIHFLSTLRFEGQKPIMQPQHYIRVMSRPVGEDAALTTINDAMWSGVYRERLVCEHNQSRTILFIQFSPRALVLEENDRAPNKTYAQMNKIASKKVRSPFSWVLNSVSS